MSQQLGHKIVATLTRVANSSQLALEARDDGEDRIYTLTGQRCKVRVTINPNRWLGLSFELLDPAGKTRLFYDIDTDLYPIEDENFREFALQIEDDISRFLGDLAAGRIRVRTRPGKCTMVIPTREGVYRVQKGRFFTKGSSHKDPNQAEKGGGFEPLIC